MALPGFYAEQSTGATMQTYRVHRIGAHMAAGYLSRQQLEDDTNIDVTDTVEDDPDPVAIDGDGGLDASVDDPADDEEFKESSIGTEV